MPIDAICRTTAMGIMPHTDIHRALELALGLDIPFFPQLPKVDFHEDMYAQASQNFPGIEVDLIHERIDFNSEKFSHELTDYMERKADAKTFDLTSEYSVVYHRFLEQALDNYEAIRGQITGPVSFGFKVVDENNILYSFSQRPRRNLTYNSCSHRWADPSLVFPGSQISC